jgi:TrmH RNA methyltransferase
MRPGRREAEIKIHGQHACRAFVLRRPDDVLRAYVAEDEAPRWGELFRALARSRRPYRVVPSEDLERLTESKHHEGICLVVRPRPPRPLADVLAPPGPGWLVALAEVGNPHNVGAILRTAAHFGARGAILGGAGEQLSAAAHRTAQGGAEALDVVFAPDLSAAFAAARAHGYSVCATSSHGGRDLFAAPLPERAILLLGSEGEGLPSALLRRADLTLRIPGTGHVESLNVATAAGVLLAELWRQHGPRAGAA